MSRRSEPGDAGAPRAVSTWSDEWWPPDDLDGAAPGVDGIPEDRHDGVFFDPPDALDHVLEVSGMVAVFTADRLEAVACLHGEMTARFRAGLSEQIRERSIRLELAAALRITEHAAGDMLRLAVAVVHTHPVLLDAVRSSAITDTHAKVLVDGVDSVEPEYRQVVLDRGLAIAIEQPVGVFRRRLKELIETVREQTLAERHELAVARRRVVVEQAEDGMAWMLLHIPAVEAHAIWSRATAMGAQLKKREGESRTLDQLRADVVSDLLIDGVVGEHPADVRGIRAQVVVTVPVLALLDEHAEHVPDGCDPASVEGLGPIPLSRARELCGAAPGWTRVLTHPETGIVLSVGRTRYRPPPELARLVKWRADRCMAPGCGVPASRCQVDHTIAWQHGGDTALWNNGPMCQGHHTVKHEGDWSVVQLDGGALRWTSPMGRSYLVEPKRRVPVFSPTREGGSAPF